MKQISSVFVALVVALTLFLFPIWVGSSANSEIGPQDVSAAACDPTYDLNGDNRVDISDLVKVSNVWRSTSSVDLAAYDFNKNNVIDVGDIVYVASRFCLPGPFGATVQGGLNAQVEDLAQQAGIGYVRYGVGWSGVEPTNVDLTDPNNGHWPDNAFLALEASGLSPVFLMMSNPSWAASTDCGPLYSSSYSDFREFVYAAAERYDGDGDYNGDGAIDGPPLPNVRLWEFFNEPDLDPRKTDLRFGGCWGDKGSEYAKLMREAYLAIKGAPIGSGMNALTGLATLTGDNSSATVMVGGMAYDSQYNNPDSPPPPCYNAQSSNFFNYYFLEDVLSTTFGDGTTGGDYFDAINFHYHRKASSCWAPWGVETLGKANYLQGRLASYGYNGVSKPRKTVAVTEDGEKRAPSPTYSDEDQARYVVMSFVRALAGKFEVLTWFSFDYFQDHLGRVFGLLDQSNNTKPGYDALKALTAKFAGAEFIGNLGASGVEGYTFSVDGMQKTAAWATGSSRSVSFTGSQIRVYNKYGTLIQQGSGSLSVTISTDPVYVEVTP